MNGNWQQVRNQFFSSVHENLLLLLNLCKPKRAPETLTAMIFRKFTVKKTKKPTVMGHALLGSSAVAVLFLFFINKQRTTRKPIPEADSTSTKAEIESSKSFCGICMEVKPKNEMFMKNINKCSHMFCFDCINKHIEAKIQQKFYCPFKNCSAMLLNDGREVIREAECPYCQRLFRAQCKVPWHSEFSCKNFQQLNKDERAREGLMLMSLATKKQLE